MDPEHRDPFDDPALKAAIRRVWKDHGAPPDLRRQMQVRAASVTAAHRPPIALAAAAIILIALGLVAWRLSRVAPPYHQQMAKLPNDLAQNLVKTHDYCCSQSDHHMPGLPRDDFSAIAKVLTARLGWPVLAAPLKDDWKFDGAAICPVGRSQSAHLVFKRGKDDISIFSLPASLAPNAQHVAEYQEVEEGHPIAAFAANGGLFCVVGSGPDDTMKLSNVRAILDELRPHLNIDVAERATVALGP